MLADLYGMVIIGLLLLVLGVLSRLGKLRRNSFAGIRLGVLLEDDRAWLVGHKAASGVMLLMGASGIVLPILLYLLVGPASWRTAFLVWLGLVVVSAVPMYRLAERAVRADRASHQRDR